eukprot:801427_1
MMESISMLSGLSMDDQLQSERSTIHEIQKEVLKANLITLKINCILQNVQSCSDDQLSILDDAENLFKDISQVWISIGNIISPKPISRFYFLVRELCSKLASLASFLHFLRHRSLISHSEAELLIGMANGDPSVAASCLKLDLEEYLLGLTELPKFLGRLCINCVTNTDFETPVCISQFVNELYAGFLMLDLRNDILRRRFDGMKYDVQKIEHCLYEISIRRRKTPSAKSGVKDDSLC